MIFQSRALLSLRLALALAVAAPFTICQTTTTTVLATSANPSVLGQALILSATVSPASATGNVTFYDGTTILGIAPLSAGRAAISAILPDSGIHPLKARFDGNSSWSASSSQSLSQTITAVAAQTLEAPVSYPTTSTINQHIATADFNGDGHVDIVTNNCTVLMGNGDGTFRAPVEYPFTSGSYAVVTGDFNGDGKPDFATAQYDGNIAVWLNKGDGTFQQPRLNAIAAAPRDLAVGDFNGDGIADIAVAARQGTAIGLSVFLGVGDGTFHPPVTYVPGTHQTALAVGDFNGDGNADIVSVSSDDIYTPVSVLLGNGDGTFQTVLTDDAVFPLFVAVGDFNQDGRPDFVVANGVNVNTLFVFLGNGDGTFSQSPASLVEPANSNFSDGIVIADFDGDGIPDIAAVSSGGAVSVFRGIGDGTFGGAVNFPAGSNAGALAAGDFNGDGRADLAVTNSSSVQILLSGSGDFPVVTTTSVPNAMGGVPYSTNLTATGGSAPYTWSLSAGSLPVSLSSAGTIAGTPSTSVLSGVDSFSVMVSGPNGAGFGSSRNLSMHVAAAFLINATNTFVGRVGTSYKSFPLPVTGGTPPYQGWAVVSGALPPGLTMDPASGLITGIPTTAGSFRSTITVSDSAGLTSLPAAMTISVVPALAITTSSLPGAVVGVPYYVPLAGTGGFTPYKNWLVSSGSLPPGLSLDPAAGVIEGTPTSASGSPFSFSITFTDSGNLASPAQPFTLSVSNPVAIQATLTTSGSPSLYGGTLTLTASLSVAGASGRFTFYDGTTVLGTAAGSGNASFATRLLAPGVHKLWAKFFGAPYAPAASAIVAQVVAANADASLSAPVSYASRDNAGGGLVPLAVADFNGDGKSDLATSGSVLLGNGDGTFQASLLHSVGSNPLSVAVGDFDENGVTDLAVSDRSGLEIFLGKGDGTFGTAHALSGLGFSGYLASADFDGDGHTDLVATDNSTQLKIFLGVGDGTFQPARAIECGVDPGAVAVGDFNGDGISDLVVVDGSSGKVNVMMGTGGGAFSAPVTHTVTSSSPGLIPLTRFVAVGDLNGDGRQDLIVYGPAYDRVSVMLGAGDGTFATPVDYPTGESTYGNDISITDFNGDGLPDLVVSGASSSSISVLLGKGDGSFQPVVNYAAGNNTLGHFVVGEFNEDGSPDIAMVNMTGTVNVMLSSHSAGDSQLTLSPASLTLNGLTGITPVTQVVTLTYQSTSSSAPAFVVEVEPYQDWLTVSALSGTMTQASVANGIYMWTATVIVSGNPVYFVPGGSKTATISFSVGGPVITLPVTMNVQQSPGIGGIVNAASEGQAPNAKISLGSYVAIYGAALADNGNPSASSLPLPRTLNGTQVTLGGIPMPLLYAASGQINALVPMGLAPGASYPLVVTHGAYPPVSLSPLVQNLQPGIYTVDASGSGAGVVTNAATGQLITPSNPAHVGDYLVIYCTGLGPVVGPTGQAGPGDGIAAPTDTIFRTTAGVSVIIGNNTEPTLFSGLTPTLAGLYQVNFQVPAGTPTGDAIPVAIIASTAQPADREQSNQVTISVR